MLVEKMEDDSIYEDLNTQGDLGAIIHNLQNKNEQLQDHVISLEEDIQKLCNKILEMKQTQENLARNISELLKTAKNEICRKDRLIADLQSQLDDLVFKRGKAPSNYTLKREREEQTLEKDLKRPKCEISRNVQHDKPLTESHRSNSETSKSNIHENDSNKPNKNTDTRESTSRRYDKYEDRSNDYRSDHRDSGKYDQRRFNDSRIRNVRRERNNHRDNNNRNRREGRTSKGGRFDDSRDHRGRNENTRNNRFDRGRETRSDERESFPKNKEEQIEARFSPVESSRSTPEPCIDSKDDLNVSREEGEISDVEVKPQPQLKCVSRRKSTIDRKMEEKKENLTTFKDDPPGDKMKSFDVTKFIQKQQKIEEAAKKDHAKAHSVESRDVKHQKSHSSSERSRRNSKSLPEKKEVKNDKAPGEKSEKKDSIKDEIKSKDKLSECYSNKDAVEHASEDEKLKKSDITIISQVILNQGKMEATSAVISRPEEEPNSKIQTVGIGEPKIVWELNRIEITKRESRVPRNLTGELDIDVKNLKAGEVSKEKQATIKQSERINKKISSLFDTPIKENKTEIPASLNDPFGLTHDGEITFPLLNVKNNSRDAISNQSITEATGNTTPVAEFQIFKTNLPSLEKSNSSSIQFQTPESQSNSKIKQTGEPKPIEMSKGILEDKTKSIPAEISSELKGSVKEITQFPPKTIHCAPTKIENECKDIANTSDICNISMDLLNDPLDEYKMEDYPNLTAYSEVKNMPSISTPENDKSKEMKNKEIFKTKASNLSNIIDKLSPSAPTEQKTDDASEITSVTPNTTQTSPSVNTSKTPGSNETRKKRKRCVMRWAE